MARRRRAAQRDRHPAGHRPRPAHGRTRAGRSAVRGARRHRVPVRGTGARPESVARRDEPHARNRRPLAAGAGLSPVARRHAARPADRTARPASSARVRTPQDLCRRPRSPRELAGRSRSARWRRARSVTASGGPGRSGRREHRRSVPGGRPADPTAPLSRTDRRAGGRLRGDGRRVSHPAGSEVPPPHRSAPRHARPALVSRDDRLQRAVRRARDAGRRHGNRGPRIVPVSLRALLWMR